MILSQFVAAVILCLALFSCAIAVPPISITVNVRNKKHKISATTVHEVCAQVHAITGIDVNLQSVIFHGKTLSKWDRLDEMGVNEGDTLNVVKSLTKKPPSLLEELTDRFQGLGGSSLAPQSQSAALKAMVREKLLKAFEKVVNSVLDAVDEFLSTDMIEGFALYLDDTLRVLEHVKNTSSKGAEDLQEMSRNFEKELGVHNKEEAIVFFKGFLLRMKESLLRTRRLRDEGQWSALSFVRDLEKFHPSKNASSDRDDEAD